LEPELQTLTFATFESDNGARELADRTEQIRMP